MPVIIKYVEMVAEGHPSSKTALSLKKEKTIFGSCKLNLVSILNPLYKH
jgi:hypothetical protein